MTINIGMVMSLMMYQCMYCIVLLISLGKSLCMALEERMAPVVKSALEAYAYAERQGVTLAAGAVLV